MATANKFVPVKQAEAFLRLQSAGLISELKPTISLDRKIHYWSFRMGEMIFSLNGRLIELDFRQYQMKVVYAKDAPPKLFITSPELPGKAKHLYSDKSLCLYKPENWQWKNEMQFDEELFPNICTWLYFYEAWLTTGIWYGEEAMHDPSPELLLNIKKRFGYARN